MRKLSFIFLLFISIYSFSQTTKKTVKKSVKKTTTKAAVLPANTSVWTIDAVLAQCEGVTTKNCLLVKKTGDKDFNLFYDNIIGFNYEEGFVYTLWVKEELKTPPIPADASMYNYTLVKIVAKKPVAKYANTTIDNKKPLSGMNSSTTKTLIINEERTACEGNPDAKCLLIKQPDAKTFEIFYQGIEGFTFEEGYRQTILVSERYVANPMVKQAEPIYTLIRVLKKELINPVKTDVVVSNQPKTILDKKWTLRKMKDTDSTSFVVDDNAVYMEINSSENRISGKAPCNNFFGGFKSDFISSFQTSAIANTKMYCSNMKMEDLFFSLLQNAERFEIKEGKLSLYKGERLLLVFE